MFDKLNYIELSGEKFPIKCDLLVLEKVQEEYNDLTDFEFKLTGFVPERDEDGEYVRSEEGLILGNRKTPEIKFLKEVLIWMIEEGVEIEKEAGGEGRKIDENEIMRKVDMSPAELGETLHEEFNRCFARKNVQTAQRN